MVVKVTVEDTEQPHLSLFMSSDEGERAMYLAIGILKIVETYRMLKMMSKRK